MEEKRPMSSPVQDNGDNAPQPAAFGGVLRILMMYFMFSSLRNVVSPPPNTDLGPHEGPQEQTRKPTGADPDYTHGPNPKDNERPLPVSSLLSTFGVPDAISNPYKDVPVFSKNGPPHTCVWPYGTTMKIDIIITEDDMHNITAQEKDPDYPPPLYRWTTSDIVFGSHMKKGGKVQDDVENSFNFTVTPAMQGNTSTFAHIYITKQGYSADSTEKNYFAKGGHYYHRWQLNKHRLRRKDRDVRSLLGEGEAESDLSEMALAQRADDTVLGKASNNKTEDVWLSYWKPTLHIRLVDAAVSFPRNGIPPQVAQYMNFVDLERGQYFPILWVNEFWMTSDHLIAINGTTSDLPLDMSIGSVPMWKWQIMAQMEQQWRMQAAMGGNDSEADIIKNMILDTNPFLLAVTMIVSVLHSVFDVLAFKNDIQFFKGKKNMEGLSIRTMVVNLFFQSIIFLYLCDNDTSFMILASNGVGLAIEVWKVAKAFKFSFEGGRISWGEKTEKESITKEYDEIAISHLLYVTMPLMTGYAIYSLTQLKHKSWYSWILNSLVGFIYMFGFVMMTPQLFINYKLKSVAHLNWRTMTYKSLSTFVDDLFAFVIKMPIMHRLACFRDDLIFFIFLYQRHIYKVDYSRVNEYGQMSEVEKAERANVEASKIQGARVDDAAVIVDKPDQPVLKQRRGARDKKG